jgi:endonuclease-3
LEIVDQMRISFPEIIRRMKQTMMEQGYAETALGQVSREERNDPFKVLIATILSHRTRDEKTSQAVHNLFSVYPNPEELAQGNLKRIQKLIRPVGFYRVKAARIREVSKILIERYRGKVPNNLENLLELPSVGRKTANCVLVYAFKKPAIPVDTHVHRISNRLGLVKTKTPEETEERLREIVKQRYWLDLNDIFVRFGQTICKPIGPKHEVCRLRNYCAYYQNIIKQRRT